MNKWRRLWQLLEFGRRRVRLLHLDLMSVVWPQDQASTLQSLRVGPEARRFLGSAAVRSQVAIPQGCGLICTTFETFRVELGGVLQVSLFSPRVPREVPP